MNKLTIKGDWNIAKGKLKQRWASLTDNDLQYVDGKEDELIGRIQKRTGETRESVERALSEWNDSPSHHPDRDAAARSGGSVDQAPRR